MLLRMNALAIRCTCKATKTGSQRPSFWSRSNGIPEQTVNNFDLDKGLRLVTDYVTGSQYSLRII